jgi:nucleotide-binding universal stress UspA family protein
VVYVPHMPAVDMLTTEAVTGMQATFGELTRDLHAQASDQLRDREERWRFERGRDMFSDVSSVLIGVAEKVAAAHPGENVAIVVGSSSQARHRMVGSVAVSLARHAPVPLLIVP